MKFWKIHEILGEGVENVAVKSGTFSTSSADYSGMKYHKKIYFNKKSFTAMFLSAALLLTSVDCMKVQAEELADQVLPTQTQESGSVSDNTLPVADAATEPDYVKTPEGAVIITSFEALLEDASHFELGEEETLEEAAGRMPATLKASAKVYVAQNKPDAGDDTADEPSGDEESTPGAGDEEQPDDEENTPGAGDEEQPGDGEGNGGEEPGEGEGSGEEEPGEGEGSGGEPAEGDSGDGDSGEQPGDSGVAVTTNSPATAGMAVTANSPATAGMVEAANSPATVELAVTTNSPATTVVTAAAINPAIPAVTTASPRAGKSSRMIARKASRTRKRRARKTMGETRTHRRSQPIPPRQK